MAIASVASVLAELPTTGALFPPARPGVAVSDRWIATDQLPSVTQQWPLLAAVPAGWHDVTAEQAALLQRQARPVFFGPSATGDPVTDLTALSTGELATAGSGERRPGRPPRVPRVPRVPRAARPGREPRPARAARAPRPPRPSRPPRMARFPRTPRTARRPYTKTKYSVGICKRPACNCWTPAGCVGGDYYALLAGGEFFKGFEDCYPGPCYDYTACVSGKCFAETACQIRSIFQFWAAQYRAAVTYAAPLVQQATATVGRRLAELGALAAGTISVAAELPAGAVTTGCPDGWYWTIGLTGCRCVAAGSNLPIITEAEVIACIGQIEWDRLVARGVQGRTA